MTVSGAGVASGGGGAGGGAGGDKGSGGASIRGSSTGRAWANLARLLALFCSCSLSRSRSRRRRSCSSRALCCCCACHSRKRAASSSVSMLIAPRAAGGAPGPRLRPASQAQVRLAGRQEGGITSGGRQGWAAQRTPQERTGEHGEKKNQCLPKYLQNKNLQIKKNLMQKNKKGGTAFFLLPLPPFRCLPPRGPRSPADKKGLCNKMARRHRHTQQGKEPRCPRPPPPLLHRGGSQSPDRSPRPQGRGVSLRAGSRQGEPRPPRAHTWLGWG